jgi:glycosyltransferase involved in cell wall biosynthesis
MASTLIMDATSSHQAGGLPCPRVVVVHSGARDAYQTARALADADLLQTLVTDLFWPVSSRWIRAIAPILPAQVRATLERRSDPGLPVSRVSTCAISGLATLLLDKAPWAPFRWRRAITRRTDNVLGRKAGRVARDAAAGLLSYSYYGHAAFTNYGANGMLFQLHPHPASMRRILTAELERYPDCASSLRQEWELALPETDFFRLISETAMARHFIAASSFTRSTLIENGVPAGAIRVIPYGVDSVRFAPGPCRPSPGGKLRLLFVGRINQRKGIRDALEALRLLGSSQIELMICGRAVDDLKIFLPFGERVIIRPDVSHEELVAAYRSAHLFVFPSLAEGFGHVLLESLACGLPILSTTRTAAPDLIEPGRQGFIVEPGQPEQLAARIEWALSHRRQLDEMRDEARYLAQEFTWERFRRGIVGAVRDALSVSQSRPTDRGPRLVL